MLLVKLWPEIGGKFDFFTVDIGQGFANLATCSFYICFLSFHMFSVECWAEVATPWRPFATQPELRRSYKLKVGQFLIFGGKEYKVENVWEHRYASTHETSAQISYSITAGAPQKLQVESWPISIFGGKGI